MQMIREENQRRLEDVDSQYEAVNKQNLLKQFLIDAFIPPFEMSKLTRQMIYNEQTNGFEIMPKDVIKQLLGDARDIRVEFPRHNNAAEIVHSKDLNH